MDETPVWADMVTDTTVESVGKKDIPMKITGHEKVRVSVCLAAKGDGTKMKPFIVFATAKYELKALHKEFKIQCSVASSGNGWMNEELTLRWINEVIGKFSFRKHLLAWGTYQCHMTDVVKKQLHDITNESVLVPGWCTKYIQAPDVSWNKPFKVHVTEQYDDWLANRIDEYTAGGSMKPAPRRKVVKWILNSWKSMPVELIAKSFRSCVLTLPNDRQEDNQISCFKPGRPYEVGREILNQQTKLLTDESLHINPFSRDITDSDMEGANEETNIIESDEEIDEI